MYRTLIPSVLFSSPLSIKTITLSLSLEVEEGVTSSSHALKLLVTSKDITLDTPDVGALDRPSRRVG